MLRSALIVSTLLAASARAHFLFLVPESDGKTARVMLSEDLQTDSDIDGDIVATAKLSVKSIGSGKENDLKLEKGQHAYTTQLAGGGLRVVHGSEDMGVQQHGPSKAYRLNYFPKTIIGNPFDPATALGSAAPLELAAVGSADHFQFELLIDGKPVPNQEINLIKPGEDRETITTDDKGLSPVLSVPGRYGAWARHVLPNSAGDRDGKHYDEARQYATLVIDALPIATTQRSLPESASSFGAVAADGWLYVYGGHIADTHEYSLQSVSGQFSRLNLAAKDSWESLPAGPHLQGMNLATWHGKIIRVGGMSPQNKEGEEANVRSVADVALFDPRTRQWSALPSIPDPRSSHDVAVIGDTLYVVGGWKLTGDSADAEWPKTMLSLDLAAPNAAWKELPEPFQRRALIAAVHDGKLYAIGGFLTEADPSLEVNVFDPKTGAWTTGPALPAPEFNGFGPAACNADGQLIVSVADGSILRLTADANAWEKIGYATPRIVHRAVAEGHDVWILGGAIHQKQTNLIERFPLPPTTQPAVSMAK